MVTKTGLFGLALGALGVVFGDIGTDATTIETVFSINNHAVAATVADVFGVVSMIFWSLTLVVSVKYRTGNFITCAPITTARAGSWRWPR